MMASTSISLSGYLINPIDLQERIFLSYDNISEEQALHSMASIIVKAILELYIQVICRSGKYRYKLLQYDATHLKIG